MNPLTVFFSEFLPSMLGYSRRYDGPMMTGQTVNPAYRDFLISRLRQAGSGVERFTAQQQGEIAEAVARTYRLSGQLNRGNPAGAYAPGLPGSGIGMTPIRGAQQYTVRFTLRDPDGSTRDVLVQVDSATPVGGDAILGRALTVLELGEITSDPSGRGVANSRVDSWAVLSQFTIGGVR